MRKYFWMFGFAAFAAIPVWAWDGYRSYPGGSSTLQLRNDLSSLERQVRDLQRQVDHLQSTRGSNANRGTQYPLPGQTVQGFRHSDNGAYELTLNGTTLRVARNGDLHIRAAGALRLEGESVVSHSRSEAAR